MHTYLGKESELEGPTLAVEWKDMKDEYELKETKAWREREREPNACNRFWERQGPRVIFEALQYNLGRQICVIIDTLLYGNKCQLAKIIQDDRRCLLCSNLKSTKQLQNTCYSCRWKKKKNFLWFSWIVANHHKIH